MAHGRPVEAQILHVASGHQQDDPPVAKALPIAMWCRSQPGEGGLHPSTRHATHDAREASIRGDPVNPGRDRDRQSKMTTPRMFLPACMSS